VRIQSSRGRPSELVADREPMHRRGIPFADRARLPRPSAARYWKPVTSVERQPAPGLKTYPGPSGAAEKFPGTVEERTPVIRHAVRFPAKSGTGDHDPVAIAGKVGEAITIFGIIRRVIRDVLNRIAISLLNRMIAVGGPAVEIIKRSVHVNAYLTHVRSANVERVAGGNFCFTRFRFRKHVTGEHADPTIALRGINAETGWLGDDNVNVGRVH